jgi:CheY-like chemotaxis protein
VLEAAEQATGVTQSLLTFSRRTPSRKAPVHLGRLLADMQRMLRGIVPASIVFEYHYARTGCLWVQADSTQLQQLVTNLVVNAREAMPDGGTLAVSVRGEPEQRSAQRKPGSPPCGAVVLTVEDTGRGMSDDVQERLFDPFFTTKPRDTGTGLGMSVVHGIVAEHDGTVKIESREGQGTQITVVFPCCGRPAQCIEHAPLLAVRDGHGETILVADSAPQILAIVTSALRSKGFEVIQARDGDQAARLYAEHRDRTRLLILDEALPKKNSLTLLREFRADRDPVPAILVTDGPDYDRPADDLTGLRLIRKPFHLGSLVNLVHEVLDIPSPAPR